MLLVDPADGHKLYADFPRTFAHYGQSPIQPQAVDLCAFPQAAHAVVRNVTLSPGDVLYIPPLWWHLVASLPRRHVGRTVSVTLQGVFLNEQPAPRFMSMAALQHEYAMSTATHPSRPRAWQFGRRRAVRVQRGGAADSPHSVVGTTTLLEDKTVDQAPLLEDQAPLLEDQGPLLEVQAEEDQTPLLAEASAWPRWRCVRRLVLSALDATSPGEFARRAFSQSEVDLAPCRTWAWLLNFSLALHFAEPAGTTEAAGATEGATAWSSSALVLGVDGGVFGGSSESAPHADVTLRCDSFRGLRLELLDRSITLRELMARENGTDAARLEHARREEGMRADASSLGRLAFPEACKLSIADVGQLSEVLPAELQCLVHSETHSTPHEHRECMALVADVTLALLERMMIGYHCTGSWTHGQFSCTNSVSTL